MNNQIHLEPKKYGVVFGFGGSSLRITVIEIGAFIKVVWSDRTSGLSGRALDEKLFNLLKTRLKAQHAELFNEQGETEYD